MYSWMYSLTSHFPGVATLVDGGLSGEGRHMVGVRIAHAENLPIVFLEGGESWLWTDVRDPPFRQ